MGVLEMIAAMEEHFGITVDFEQMDTEEFAILGCFSRYVAKFAVAADGRRNET
jgi:acyl carrier protein